MRCLLLMLTLVGAVFAATAENVLWIESENTMGVHRSKGDEAGMNADRIIPVPWTRLWSRDRGSTEPMTLSNLVSVARLARDADRIKYFEEAEQVFKVWTWYDPSWGYLVDAHWRENMPKSGDRSADTTCLERGRGLWLRAVNGADAYLIGQSSTNAAVSVLAAENPYAEDAKLFTENFVVNPCDTDVDLVKDGMVVNAVVGDEVNVVTPMSSFLYWYRVPTGGVKPAWCTLDVTKETVTTPWGATVEVEKLAYVKCEMLPVPYGAGVWYSCVTNAVHNPPPEIRWRHQEEFRR